MHGALIPLPLSKGLLYIFLLRVGTHEKRFTTEVNKAKMYIITKAAENRLLDYRIINFVCFISINYIFENGCANCDS